MDLSIFIKYYLDTNYNSQLSIDKIFLVKVWALLLICLRPRSMRIRPWERASSYPVILWKSRYNSVLKKILMPEEVEIAEFFDCLPTFWLQFVHLK